MKIFRIVVVLVVVAIILFFAIPNSRVVIEKVTFFNQHYENVRLIYLMLYAFLFGLVSVCIFAIADEISLRREIHRQRRANRDMAEELDALRNLPIGPEEQR